MKISNYAIRKKLKALVKQNQNRKGLFKSFADVNRVLLLYQMNQKQSADICIKKLQSEGKEVVTAVFAPILESDAGIPEGHIVMRKVDIDLWGSPSHAVCNMFVNVDVDILIDLTAPDCYVMKALMLMHPVDFKIGINWGDNAYYDFAVSVTDNNSIPYLFDQILFYLQTIKSK